MNVARFTWRVGIILLAGAWFGPAAAQSIYTCVDAKGRRLTSDRPINECNDRVQKELTKTGTVRREIGPSLTAQERAKAEEEAKVLAAKQAREADEKRRDRALLTRYPDRAAHDRERVLALAQIDEVIKAATKRVGELAQQRKSIEVELEFFKSDPSKIPPLLKRQIEENARSTVVQQRFIGEQDNEKKRVNLRFNEELVKLNELWLLKLPPEQARAALGTAAAPPLKPASASAKR